MRRFLFLALLVCALSPLTARAQQKLPLEISADKTLEWHRNDHRYIARGNAVAKQGATELHGDTLTANYLDGSSAKGKGLSITRIDATGNVVVVSDGSRATGDKGYYDIKSGFSELTGGNLSLTTPTDKVTARDRLTYNAGTREMTAEGQARAVRGDDVITADKLIGRFVADPATNATKLKELEAVGHVVITTPTDVLYGDHGTYDAQSDKATIIGNVRIERGPNIITGARGEVDLNTNVSRIFGGPQKATAPADDTQATGAPSGTPSGDGRVRGVFYPE